MPHPHPGSAPCGETPVCAGRRGGPFRRKGRTGDAHKRHGADHPGAVARITQFLGDSATFDFSPYEGTCGLVFIDGSHAFDYALSDTARALKLVAEDGVVIWHDYGVWEGVTRALEKIERERRLGLKSIQGTSLVYWRRAGGTVVHPGAMDRHAADRRREGV